MIEVKKLKDAFIVSLLAGLCIWCFTRVLLPINPPFVLSSQLYLFVGLCIVSIFLGYFIFKAPTKNLQFPSQHTNSLYLTVVSVVIISFILRYVDLFFYRDLLFSNRLVANRVLINENFPNVPTWLSIAATFRGLYFLPLLYCILSKSKQKLQWILATICVTLLIPELLLTGSRKPVFQLGVLVIIGYICTYGFKVLLKRNSLIAITISLILAFGFSFFILKKRISDSKDNVVNLTDLLNSKYNDMVPLNSTTLESLKKAPPNDIKANVQLLVIHTGQYVVLGIYEFNQIIQKKDLQFANGAYTFYPITKLLVKLNVLDDAYLQKNYNPRENVYLSAFGGLYLDFGWFALLFFFCLGVFQRIIIQLSHHNSFFLAVFVYLLFINICFPIINILSGSGIYPIAGFLLLFLSHELYFKIKKSTRS